jgi:hypothetical protein
MASDATAQSFVLHILIATSYNDQGFLQPIIKTRMKYIHTIR